MAIGLFDQEDVDVLIKAYGDLKAAMWKAALATNDSDQMLIKSGLHQVLAEHGYLRPFDYFHHAPRCPANNWCKMQVPRGPCQCGAACAAYLSPEGKRLQDEGKLDGKGRMID